MISRLACPEERAREQLEPRLLVEGEIGLHLALDLQLGRLGAQQPQRRLHLAGRDRGPRAEARMRQHRHLRPPGRTLHDLDASKAEAMILRHVGPPSPVSWRCDRDVEGCADGVRQF